MEPVARWPVDIPTRLRPLAVIGGGSQATVWRARDAGSGAEVAVKVLHGHPSRRPRDDAELRALARVRDIGGVVRIEEVGRCRDGRVWMVLTLMAGGTLEDRAGPDPTARLRDAVRLADALDALHAVGVVHGDISPRNVLYDAAGRAHLADLGASVLDGVETGAGALTPAVAAPERLRGAPASAAGDVYSLAATVRWSLGDAGAPWLGQLSTALSPEPGARPPARHIAQVLRRELASPR